MLKNGLTPESGFYERSAHTHGLLRVMESVRAAEGDGPLGRLYEVYGTHIHEGSDLVDAATALREAGLEARHADAAHDGSWDAVIRNAMDEGLALTGTDVGTPLLGFDNAAGIRVGYFGPVISRRLRPEAGLRLWDGLMLVAAIPEFWELKRTRTVAPDFGEPG